MNASTPFHLPSERLQRWTAIHNLAAWANVPSRLAELVVDAALDAGFTVKELRGSSRRSDLVAARWAAAKRAHDLGYSYFIIARAMNRDHTSIMHAVKAA